MVFDHGLSYDEHMDSMSISQFKATCLAALERVRRTGRSLRVTRFGKPVADIVAPRLEAPSKRRLGVMASEGQIDGDIISPLDVEWDALKKNKRRSK